MSAFDAVKKDFLKQARIAIRTVHREKKNGMVSLYKRSASLLTLGTVGGYLFGGGLLGTLLLPTINFFAAAGIAAGIVTLLNWKAAHSYNKAAQQDLTRIREGMAIMREAHKTALRFSDNPDTLNYYAEIAKKVGDEFKEITRKNMPRTPDDVKKKNAGKSAALTKG